MQLSFHRNKRSARRLRGCAVVSMLAIGFALAAMPRPAIASGSPPTGGAPASILNPVSQFPITIDGQFTGSTVVNSVFTIGQEWSDITPAAFIAATTPTGNPTPVALGDPRANALLYAGLDPGVDNVYLMYDFSARTIQTFAKGEVAADIAFPVTIKGAPRQDIHVTFTADGQGGFSLAIPGQSSTLGMEGALGFGPSTLTTTNHLLVELAVPLAIPENFGPAFPQTGEPGVYSPSTAFWSSSLPNNPGDPPTTSAIFTINPDGSTLIVPTLGRPVPEPSTVALATASLLSFVAFRRRRCRSTRIVL